jgi:hypothetical protein
MDLSGAFFLAGMMMLAACMFLIVSRFARTGGSSVSGRGWRPIARLGWRNAAYRPTRSVAAMTMIAAAAFILIAVDTFRKEGVVSSANRSSGVGGYALTVETMIPIVYDPSSGQGREELGLGELAAVHIEPFRVRPGDDASCLNLYQPKNPRIIAPRDRFIQEGRFSFHSSRAATATEKANPWLLLQREEGADVVPVIADANSMTYVLHRALGEDIPLTLGERTIQLRLVAALEDSIFQGELLMSQANFLRLFPKREGYQFLLVETTPDREAATQATLEEALEDYGADVRSTVQRLVEFHQVENTYLSTFQMLGGLGLLLGTFGLGAVLLRNVMERRQQLALLRALGYRRAHFFVMTIAENGVILLGGLLTGVVCAMLVILPTLLEETGRIPARSMLLLLLSVLIVGLVTSIVATAAALRSSLLETLRSE